jgi:hypothetical protein
MAQETVEVSRLPAHRDTEDTRFAVEVGNKEVTVTVEDNEASAEVTKVDGVPPELREITNSWDTIEKSDMPTADYNICIDDTRGVGSRNLSDYRESENITMKYISFDCDGGGNIKITVDYDDE